MNSRDTALREVFNSKRVLYIGVAFYEYHLAVKHKIESYGAEVSFFAERDTSILYGLINRLLPRKLDAYQRLYYTSVVKQIKDLTFDYLLVIRGHRMPLTFVKQVKQLNPNIKCIMYQWDANINSPFINLDSAYDLTREFDKVFSFDYKDVKENSWIKYSPTFHIDEITSIRINTNNIENKYDFFFFGSYLPERYDGLLKFQAFAREHGYSFYSHFYMPYRYYFIERLKGKKIDRNLIKNNPMNRALYLDLFSKSNVIIDVSNAKQTGIAMRVIDAIGCGKKVLTTNKWIEQEKNINPDQIAIIDLNNIRLPSQFMEKKVTLSDSDYTIDNWLKNLFLD